jgi:ribosomal protection tetracycline resistance protein
MRTLNLGILAHVDAGKTSLTERLLYAAGVIDRIGSVDDGNTQTDTLALERQRGITIKAAVVSFVVGDVTINLIDTPGHPDFIAEVERVLNVLDGAVLVVSAVEGVQAQTRVLMRALRRLRIPTLIFVNKIDRRGAESERVLEAIGEKLTPAVIAVGAARGEGTKGAEFVPFGDDDRDFRDSLAERLSERDDAILAAYVADEMALSSDRLRDALARQSRVASVHPVFFGSAITGAGIEALTTGITELLPATEGDADGPVSGTVFKVERSPAGEKIAYVRMFSGTVRARERLRFGGTEAKVTGISVFDRGSVVRRASVAAGQIGRLSGLAEVRIGDAIGAIPASTQAHHFAPPTLETLVVPRDLADAGGLWTALTQLAEQDPLINLRKDDARREIFVSLYGEVQKEVIQQTLWSDFGIDVEFRETTVICIERPIGTGTAAEFVFKARNPFLATVGLRIDPAPIGSGVSFTLEVNSGAMPAAFYRAVEETVRETLRQGLHGWEVTDCAVAMTHSGYTSPSSTAADFRNLTPLVLMQALKNADTVVCEPFQHFELEIPADTLAALLPVLGRVGAVPQTPAMRGSSCTIEGDIPASRVHKLQQQLPALTRGEGVLECAFDSYRPVAGPIPSRGRSDFNPLDRDEYLLRLEGRVLTATGEHQ